MYFLKPHLKVYPRVLKMSQSGHVLDDCKRLSSATLVHRFLSEVKRWTPSIKLYTYVQNIFMLHRNKKVIS